MKNLSSTVLLITLTLSAPAALAGSMMCGGTVIEDGQPEPVTAEQIVAACGEPTSKEFGQWVYAQPGELAKTLRFDTDGNLLSISTQFDGD